MDLSFNILFFSAYFGGRVRYLDSKYYIFNLSKIILLYNGTVYDIYLEPKEKEIKIINLSFNFLFISTYSEVEQDLDSKYHIFNLS